MKRSSDFDRMTIPPWVGMGSNPSGTKSYKTGKDLG
jgi:hypothetical protein